MQFGIILTKFKDSRSSNSTETVVVTDAAVPMIQRSMYVWKIAEIGKFLEENPIE